MVIIGLLLIALVCLIVGLVLPNTAWLIASLIASAGVGYLLWRSREALAAHAGAAGARARKSMSKTAATESADSVDAATESVEAESIAAEPVAAEPVAAEPVDADITEMLPAVEEEPIDAPAPAQPAVAAEPLALVPDEPTAEPIAAPTSEPTIAAARSRKSSSEQYVADDGDVWVIDGRPRYHLAHCAIIQGQDAEPIPFEQDTEDGFMPCSLCEPNAVRAS